jgi:hypothetical protein
MTDEGGQKSQIPMIERLLCLFALKINSSVFVSLE